MRRVLLVLVSACLPLAVVSTRGQAAPAPAAELAVQVSGAGVGMYPAFSSEVERYAITTTGETAGTVTVGVTAVDPSSEVRINGRLAIGGTRTIDGLQPGDEIAVFVSDATTTATYSLVYLPAGFPTLVRNTSSAGSDTPSPGLVMLTLALWVDPSPFFEVAVDANGVPAYVSDQQNSLDLKRLPNGHYSAARGTGTAAGSEIVELDEQFGEVARYRTVGLVNTDGHDSILQPDGSRYLLAYEPDPSTGKTDTVVQHVGADGQVLFEWNSRDHVDIAAESMMPTDHDYAHVNSIQVMSDGDLLVSFRHFSSVFKIARSAHDGLEQGDVVWRLGGRASDFTFLDTEGAADGGPCAQHTATELDNGDIMVFDNGSWAANPLCVDPADPSGPPVARPVTRVAVWSPDESTGEADMVTDIQVDSRFALFAGSAQPLPGGNIMIGWASSTDAVATEVDAEGNLLWELVAEGSPKYFTYRAFKTAVPDHIDPSVAVAVPAEGATFVQGASVQPVVECTDRGGSSLRTCTSPAIDTSTPGSRVFTATATDGAGNVSTVHRSYVVQSGARADALIRKVGAGSFRGDDVYGQRKGQRVKATLWRPGQTATAVIRIENDGTVPDRFAVRKLASSGPFTSRLRVPDGVRTSPVLAPGEHWTVRLRVTRGRAADRGDVVLVRAGVRSAADPTSRDTVWFRVRAR